MQGTVTKMEQPARSLQPNRTYLGWSGPCNHQQGQPAPEAWPASPSPAGWIGRTPCRTPATPFSKHSMTHSSDYRSERRAYQIVTWHTQNHTNNQHHAKISSLFDQIYHNYIQWYLGMPMQRISPISINVIANLPKYTLNKIVHTIHRKTINPDNQPALGPHKQIEYE